MSHTNHDIAIKMRIAHFNWQTVKITTVLSLRDPEGVVAISQNHLVSCMYSGEYETFSIRLPRRFAPRNDTSGAFSTRWQLKCALHILIGDWYEKLVKLGYTNIIEIGGMNSWPGETVTGDK